MSDESGKERSESLTENSENKLIATVAHMGISTNTTTVQSSSDMSKDVANENLLKTLLSTSTALSSIILPSSTSKASKVSTESMITKEVNDTQLNLKKILYEPEKDAHKDKDQESTTVQTAAPKNSTEVQPMDDDDRLVIDISDDEHSTQTNKKRKKQQSMPTLDKGNNESSKEATNNMPKSITYSLETTAVSSSCVKIDILTTSGSNINLNVKPEVSQASTKLPSSSMTTIKLTNVSIESELQILCHEIDKQLNRKTNDILELVKDYLASSIGEAEFHCKMNEMGNISASDFSIISKKLIKRHKYEPNPNQKDFMRIKQLQFPTSSKDLVNYFANLIPTMCKDKFVEMIKFYEIIVKEMFNLNKTKTLQYLIDFMIKRKNAQIDFLNYNLETLSLPNFKSKSKSTSSTQQVPDSTQNTKNERKIITLRDTSYNFVIRSDPIYLTAGSTFMTNHRDVIKCRTTPSIQTHTFERRPFDNNVLKGRKIVRRITNADKYEEGQQPQNVINQQNNEINIHMSKIPDIVPSKTAIDELKKKEMSDENIITKPIEIQSNSPILVESDTGSSSPPIHKIIRPQPTKAQPISERTFIEKNPAAKQTFEFSLSSHPSTNNPGIEKISKYSFETSVLKGQLSLNEIKTLNKNGTEIIPTPSLRNKIVARRKTIDVDHAPNIKSSLEVKKIELHNQILRSPTLVSTTKTAFDYIHGLSPVLKQPGPRILKRRQSCHERIFIPNTKAVTTAANSGNSFVKIFGDFKFNKGEYERKKNEGEKSDPNLKTGEIQNQNNQLFLPQKRVRFMNDEDQAKQSLLGNKTQINKINKSQQSENIFQRSSLFQTLQNPLMQTLPTKTHQSSIDYHQYQQNFERELRDHGYVDNLQNRDTSSIVLGRPLEFVSHIPPERYLQQQSETTQAYSTSKPARSSYDKTTRNPQRTPSMINDEKATIVAYQQLQSLHRDPSNLTAQQYSEHLKQLHQLKQIQLSPFSSSQTYHQDQQNQLLESRNNFYKGHQVSHQDSSNSSTRPSYDFLLRDSASNKDSGHEREQSLQRKLKSKAKSSKYVEPSLLAKSYYNAPHSTYYPEPYITTVQKKPSTPLVYSHSTERQAEQHTQDQLAAFYNMRNDIPVNSQYQYQWMLAQQNSQQQHQPNLTNQHNQLARPIPRQAVPASFTDVKMIGAPSSHNLYPHSTLQSYSNQQSELYRQFYHQKNY